jgi:transposase InsO family protein
MEALHENRIYNDDPIEWHLQHHHQTTLARATINRILLRSGQVTPDPSKRPKSSYIRFEAEQPNETWQSDFTHYRLTHPDGRPGTDVEIISWLDDHSRYALHASAHTRITTPIVLATFRKTAGQHGIPASTLTDNGMVYTVRLAGTGRQGGRNGFEQQLVVRTKRVFSPPVGHTVAIVDDGETLPVWRTWSSMVWLRLTTASSTSRGAAALGLTGTSIVSSTVR